MLNCEAFQPFEVLEFPYEFDGDPERVMKLWIVALNVPIAETLICFKPTTTTRRFDQDAQLLAGVVDYKKKRSRCLQGKNPDRPERLSDSLLAPA